MKPYVHFLIAGVFTGLSASTVFANEARHRQHEAMRDSLQPERIAEAEEELLFEDDEFGEQLILRRLPPPPLVTVFADGGASYNSNPLLLPDGSRGDYLYTGTVGGSLRPHFIRDWEPALALEIFAQYQIFRYDRLTPLDFNALEGGFLASYTLPHRIEAYGGWSGNRLEDRAGGDRFFEESKLTLGLSKMFREDSSVSSFAGFQGDLRHTSPSSLSRLEYGPYVGIRFLLKDNLPFTLRYRLAHQHYLQDGRDDLNSWFTLAASWHIRPSLALRMHGNVVFNNSNRPANDYDLVTGRLGAGLALSF